MAAAAGPHRNWTAIISGAWLRPRAQPRFLAYCASIATVAVATLVAAIAYDMGLRHVSAVLLLAVTLNAILWGLAPSLLSAAICAGIEAYLFYAPIYDFRVYAADDVVDLIVFSIVAVIVSDLVVQLRRHVGEAEHREAATARLQAFSRALSGIADADELYLAVIEHLEEATGRTVLLFLPDRDVLLPIGARMHDGMAPAPLVDRTQALWRERETGAGDDSAVFGDWRLHLLRTWRGPVAVLAIEGAIKADSDAYLGSLLNQAAIAVERTLLARAIEDSRVSEARDRLHEALINSVSHSLQTPLAVIIGSATSLQGLPGSRAGAAEADLVASIREEAERLERFVGKILQMTRIRAGAIAPKLELVELPDIINSALRRMRRALEAHPVTVVLPRDLPMLRLDLFLMEEALANLLENAAKYSPRGAPIVVRVAIEGATLVIDVADRGPGVAPDSLPRLFDPFFRAGAPDQSPPGTGLGLAICRAFVEANGGQVAVESASAGSGAIFRIRLPLPEDAVAESAAADLRENPDD